MALALEVEGVELERRELAVSPEFRRVTTTVHLHGGGEESLGEDVTYQADLHDTFPEPSVAGRWTLASFSESLAGFSFFETELPDNAANDYRRWAWESAALDLALRQAKTSLADVTGRKRQPVRYVVSTRVEKVPRVLELYPTICAASWTRRMGTGSPSVFSIHWRMWTIARSGSSVNSRTA